MLIIAVMCLISATQGEGICGSCMGSKWSVKTASDAWEWRRFSHVLRRPRRNNNSFSRRKRLGEKEQMRQRHESLRLQILIHPMHTLAKYLIRREIMKPQWLTAIYLHNKIMIHGIKCSNKVEALLNVPYDDKSGTNWKISSMHVNDKDLHRVRLTICQITKVKELIWL